MSQVAESGVRVEQQRRRFRVWRGGPDGGRFVDYEIEVDPGMVVLDALHRIQQRHAPDLAVRWNCKAGKCGSCSMEIDGRPRLACMTRLSVFPHGRAITVQPLKTFPVIRDLVTDVSWNYERKASIVPFRARKPGPDGRHRMDQRDAERVQEFRKCIECFLCQDVCHILRDRAGKDRFVGPRLMVHLAQLEMNPLDAEDRVPKIRHEYGSGMCNITRCCTEVCPEGINITDNAIIPLKERVVDRYFDPIAMLLRKMRPSR